MHGFCRYRLFFCILRQKLHIGKAEQRYLCNVTEQAPSGCQTGTDTGVKRERCSS